MKRHQVLGARVFVDELNQVWLNDKLIGTDARFEKEKDCESFTFDQSVTPPWPHECKLKVDGTWPEND